jgi:hypothetical protein
VANTGGGGGSGSQLNAGAFTRGVGGSGGSGVVILKFPARFFITGGVGLTYSTSIVGSSKIVTFTAGTGNIQFRR